MTEDSITNKTEKTPLLMNVSKEVVLSGVTGLLVLVVVFQSFQLQQLKGYSQGLIEIQTAQASTVSVPVATPPAPTRPSNGGLPAQVGGC